MDIGSFNFGGLASGIDTKAIIEAILSVERRPINRLQTRESELSQEKSALDELRSKLNVFLNALKDVSSDQTFRARATTLSSDDFFSATAGTAAETGLFAVEVLQLAEAHKVAGNGLAAADQPLVSDGTITIQSGSGDVVTVDVSAASGNNTLEAVRDAINSADKGIGASILYDGASYRLVVRADETGTANALTLTDGTNLGLDAPGNELIAAADSIITVDTITVTNSSNKVSGVIEGVTLDLLQTTTGTAVSLGVEPDVEGVVEAVSSLIAAYNEASGYFTSQLDRDNPGPLAGNSFVRRLQTTLQSFVTRGVDGIPFGGIRALSSIGVSFDGRSGELSLDAAALTEVLENQFDEVGNLFLTSGQASSAFVRFLGAGDDSIAGDYAIDITQAAATASVVGTDPIRMQGLFNDEVLTITVNGVDVDVSLLKNQNITEIVDTINTALGAAGVDATASDNAGALQIATTLYGSDQAISVISDLNNQGNGKQSGFDDTSPTTAAGLDVAGSIDGIVATGAGRTLTAPEGGNTSGLSLLITATDADVIAAAGDFGTVSFSTGLTQSIISELSETTRIGDGRIVSSQEIIDGQLRSLSDEIQRLEERLTSREARLVRQFAAAERAISLLQSQQNSLAGFIPPE